MAAGKSTISDEEILQFFRDTPDPVLSAGECAEAWDMTSEGARKRLNSLVDEDELETKKPGHRTRVYWLPEGSEDSA